MIVQDSASGELRTLRVQRGLSTREVALLSKQIASDFNNEELALSHARLVQIENDESTPSIYKLFTLSVIYGKPITDLISHYVNLNGIAEAHLKLELPQTRLTELPTYDDRQRCAFPIRIDANFKLDKTSPLHRLAEVWGDIPFSIVRQLNLRSAKYGIIGLQDFTMYPLIRPGSIVQIDDHQKTVTTSRYRTEFDRPIYFIELRDGFLCSWCEMKKRRLIAIPHPLSPYRIQEFAYPGEAEIIGRVVAVAARIVDHEPHAVRTQTVVDDMPAILGE